MRRETGSISLGVPKLFVLAALLAIEVPQGSDGAGKGLGSPPSTEVGFRAAGSLQAGQGSGCPGPAGGWWDPWVQVCGCPPHGGGAASQHSSRQPCLPQPGIESLFTH